MRVRFGVVMVTVLLASTTLGSDVSAKEPEPKPESEVSLTEDGGGGLEITHGDSVLIDDADSTVSVLTLRDPGTTDDWQIIGGAAGDLVIIDPDLSMRTGHRDGADGDSFFIGRDDVTILAQGTGTTGGDITLTADGTGGDILLNADGDRTIVQSFLNASPVTEVFRLQADVPPQQVFENFTSGAEWFFAMTADDQFKISRAGTGKVEAKFFDTGNLALAGTLIQGSDENVKNSIEPADTAAILNALVDLDIATWEYDTKPGVTHLGPMAQDFAATFGYGDDPTGIAAIDADGVALAAIQALAAENAAQDQLINQLVARIEALETQN